MAQYPNYSFQQPQMNPYQNSYQPMQNPYLAQIGQYQQNFQPPQIQQAQQPQQQSGLVGRVVNDFSEVKADDVPMNGTPAIFIKSDMSEIEVRIWGNDGLIHPTPYKPILEQKQQEDTNTTQMDFNALNEDVRALREDILARLDAIEKSVAKPSGGRGKKAEVVENE